jgi:hypothetical protein
MSKKITIGLCGVAKSGKDLFCNLLINNLSFHGFKAKRFALADRLKNDLKPIFDKLNIDIWNCNANNKELVRDLMVAYGKAQRIKSEGKYWTRMLTTEIEADDCDVAIVTDIRYDVYPQDELYWCKEKMGGVLVHISRFNLLEGVKTFIQPPNQDELANDPKLKAAADYCVEWHTGIGDAMSYVNAFSRFVVPLIKNAI